MSSERKTDIGRIVIYSALSAVAVLCLWALKNPRFQQIPAGLAVTGAVALLIEILIFSLIKGRRLIRKVIRIFLLSVVNVSVFTCGIIYFFAPAVILQPHQDNDAYESLKTDAFVEELTFEGTNGKINGWLYPVDDSAPVILYFYGNYETASTAMKRITASYESTVFNGFNVAVLDYPAYGNSEGRCTDEALEQFALDAYKEIKKHYSSVIVFGYSVGTGPAVYLAAERETDGLVLYAPYDNGADLYNNVIDIFHGPLEALVDFDIESGKYAPGVTEKTFIAASSGDRVIPMASSLELSGKLKNVSFYEAEDIGHNDFFSNADVKSATVKFLDGVTEK